MELVPGIHRIESVLGPRPFSQYLLRDERALLFDTGCADTPDGVILPFLDGLEPELVLVSHADVDHFGGNAAIRAAAPAALLAAHAADVPWIESGELILRERYGWYEPYGIGYPPETSAWLAGALGPDTPVDLHLRGGERLRLGPSLTLEVLHLPGHTDGHLGLWEPVSRTAIVMDAVMGRGLLDTEGRVVHPSPYFDVDAYLGSVRTLQALAPALLLTAHYHPFEGAAVGRFLRETAEFVAAAARVGERELEQAGTLTLAALLPRADARLGPFSSMPNELAGSLRAPLQVLARDGKALEDTATGSWTATRQLTGG